MEEGRGEILKSSCYPFLFEDSELRFCSHLEGHSAGNPVNMDLIPGGTEKVGCFRI